MHDGQFPDSTLNKRPSRHTHGGLTQIAGQFPDSLLTYFPLTHRHGGTQINGQLPEFSLNNRPLRQTQAGGGGGGGFTHMAGQFPESSLTN